MKKNRCPIRKIHISNTRRSKKGFFDGWEHADQLLTKLPSKKTEIKDQFEKWTEIIEEQIDIEGNIDINDIAIIPYEYENTLNKDIYEIGNYTYTICSCSSWNLHIFKVFIFGYHYSDWIR